MLDVLLNKFEEGLSSSLTKNRFASALYLYMKTSGGIPEDALIQGFVRANNDQKIEVKPLDLVETDRRFNTLMFKGIRRFPGDEDKFFKLSFVTDVSQKEDAPDWSRQQTPCSVVFMGHNGVGKTTVFYCLEKASLGILHSVLYREAKDYEEKNFLKNFKTPEDAVSIHLETQAGQIQIGHNELTEGKPVMTPACFCSNSDVVRLLRDGISADFIAEQLGLGKYWNLLKLFQRISREIAEFRTDHREFKKDADFYEAIIKIAEALKGKDTDGINSFLPFYKWETCKHNFATNSVKRRKKSTIIKKAVNALVSFVDSFSNDDDRNLVADVLGYNEIHSVIENLAKHSEDQSYNQVFELGSERIEKLRGALSEVLEYESNSLVKDVKPLDDFIEKLKSLQKTRKEKIINIENEHPILKAKDNEIADFDKVYSFLLDGYVNFLEMFKKQSETIFSKLFSRYFENDIKSFSIDVKKEIGGITLKVIPCDPTSGQTFTESASSFPQLFLNMFRFKLFTVALKISLAIFARQLHCANFPFVIDDVFDSSDFTNKEKIQEFVEYIFEVHEDVSVSHGQSKQSPPLQLIFFTQDDIIADSVYRGIKWGRKHIPVKLSRIFDFIEANDKDEKTEKDEKTGNKYRVVEIEDVLEQINGLNGK